MVIVVISTTQSVNAGNDFIGVDLRTDLASVYTAQDYQVWISSNAGPSGNYPTFTTGWLSVNLDDEPGDYGHLFTQVGLMTDSLGIYWFVYAEPGVECLRGSYAWYNSTLGKYLGCKGVNADIVNFGHLHRVELVTYGEGFWIARVEDNLGIPYDVAKILSDSPYIYDADVVFEEGWTQSQDPFETGYFFMRNPGYNNWSTGFSAWPTSGPGGNNTLYPLPSNICPQYYGAVLDINADPRYWFAGTGGIICNAFMFPATNIISLPLIMNQ